MNIYWKIFKYIFAFIGENNIRAIKLLILNNFAWMGLSNSVQRLDQAIINFFEKKKGLIFLEVGAADGLDQSNSLLLERKYGWSGYLIESNPHLFNQCRKSRKDVVVESYALVSEEISNLTREVSLSNNQLQSKVIFDKNSLENTKNSNVNAKTITLDKFIEHHDIKTIDVFILDVEGNEINVLEGYTGDKNIIKYLVVETWDYDLFHVYAKQRGWSFIKKLGKWDYLYKL
ncbi:MAG: FkbM family methyltransferase [Gammaproteobacteria bacterium]